MEYMPFHSEGLVTPNADLLTFSPETVCKERRLCPVLLFQHIGVEIHRKHTQKIDGNMFGMTLVEEGSGKLWQQQQKKY